MSIEMVVCPNCECVNILGSNECFNCEKEFPDYEILEKVKYLNLLPQYHTSTLVEQRTFSSMQGNESIDRSESIIGKIKEIDNDETILDSFDHFTSEKFLNKYRQEFQDRLTSKLGKYKSQLFQKTLTKYWKDGLKKRTKSKEILDIKSAIKEYLLSKNKYLFCIDKTIGFKSTTFNKDDIYNILEINKELFDLAIKDWIEVHSKNLEISTNEIYFRRGINADFDQDEAVYYEKDYINSYSLSLSVVEKFSQTGPNGRTIINGEYGIFHNRILFFAPFINGLEGQLEIGIIPHYSKLEYRYQDTIEDIKEYILID